MAFSSEPKDEIIELSGKLGLTEIGQGLMHSVIEADKESDDGKLIKEAINQGLGGFVPDMVFEQLVKDYSYTEQMYGKTFLNLLSGYDSDYLGRNVKIPEFQRELKKKIAEKIEKLQEEGFIDKENKITEKGLQMASLVMYVEELDAISARGLGEKVNKKKSNYGEKSETHNFRKHDRYVDISIRKSIKKAARRQHSELLFEDIETHKRESKGNISVIYGIDASGSMKGNKLDLAKKAGIALAFTAIERKDKVGLVVFSKEVKEEIMPTLDFGLLLRAIVGVKAARETDIVLLLHRASEMFPRDDSTKHLIVLSDALPTVGKKPEEETLEAVSTAFRRGVTVSIIGIGLNKKGSEFGKKVAEVGNGKFYVVRNIDELDRIVLEDYYSVM